jgi:hypothetical protein
MQVKIETQKLQTDHRKCATLKIFGNDDNKSKFDRGENYEEIQFW